MASMSISGVASGMDWESMITEIVNQAQQPAMVKVNRKTNLTNKKSLFEEMKVTMNTIQSSLSPLKLPSTYKAKEIEIERIDTTGSYKGVLTATVNADAEVNVYDLEVKQLATAQTNRSKQITASDLKTTLDGLESSKLYINAAGQTVGIDVYNTDSLQSLKSRINTVLKTLDSPIGVTASVVDNKLILKSDSTGLGTSTVSGTINSTYNSSGVSSLKNIITNSDAGNTVDISVDESNLSRLKITSGSKSYTAGTDYELVNGNEIRWRQYEDTGNVKLGESVGVTYAMAAGDKYKITAKRGSDDTDSGVIDFDITDGGTLASRLKIEATTSTTTTETETVNADDTNADDSDTTTTTTYDSKGNKIVTTVTKEESTDDDGNTIITTTTTVETTSYYTYGKDFTIDDDGGIEWLPELASESLEPSSYTLTYSKDVNTHLEFDGEKAENSESEAIDISGLLSAYEEATGSAISTKTLQGSDGVLRTYLNPSDRLLLTITDEDDNEYVYGRDFVITVDDSGEGYNVSWFVSDDIDNDGNLTAKDANVIVSKYIQEYNISTLGFKSAPDAESAYTLNFDYTTTDSKNASVSSSSSDKSLTTLLGTELDEDEYQYLTIKDSDGNEYTYTADADELGETHFTIDEDGNIVWGTTTVDEDTYNPTHPTKGTEYTITYESFTALEAESEYDSDEDETAVNIEVDSGYGNISEKYLSYEQVLKDNSLTAKSTQTAIDKKFANVFTLTDDDGNLYTYGTDYIVTYEGYGAENENENEDSDVIDVGASDDDDTSTERQLVIKWLDDGDTPSNGAELTLNYSGRGTSGGETIEIENAVTRSATDIVMSGVSGAPDYSDFEEGTTTIRAGSKTFYQGIDFEVDENDAGNVIINWKTGTDYEWFYPSGANASYTVNLTTSDGTVKTYSGTRNYQDTLDLRNFGFEDVNGSITTITYNGTTYDLTSETLDSNGKTQADLVKSNLGITLNEGTNGGVTVYNFDWTVPDLTSRTNLPSYGDELSVEYEYDTNTFTLSDDGDGLVDLLGLNDDYTAAKQAILVLDGEEVTRDSNYIGESYENELIKGVTLQLKGVGEVSMDIAHDAEKAVESIQTFVENYNSLMSWINTRMTESQVDEDTAATIDSDDFRMRWGLLHGNSLLRNTKSQMRNIVAQNFTFSFTQRTSSEEIYGAMSYNGLKADSTLRLRIGSKYVDVPILTTDTIQDIADKINDSSNLYMRSMYYDDDGKLLEQPLLKASVSEDKLIISSTSDNEITMSGSAAMNALKMNYTYKGIYQLGIATTSNDYGKSGELEFDTEKFMAALEDNPDETQALMLKFTSEMDTWMKSMLMSSATGQTSGTLTREIENLQSQIDDINDYLEDYQDRLDRMEESLRSRYASAETQFSKLSQQAGAIASILNQLNGYSNNNNSNS